MKHLILGNGPAGVVAVEALRKADPRGEIVMVGSENEPPYSRMAIPYLLEGNIEEPGTWLRKTPGHFDALGVRQLSGRAVALDVADRRVLFADGHFEHYDRLLVATGSHPVRPPIPGVDLPEVQTCWTLEDARAIARLAKPGSRVLQLGAGFIGCIIMEALAKRGVQLTVVEMGDRMVPRMMTPQAGGMIKRWVENQGIRVVTSAGVERIDHGDGHGAPLLVSLSTGDKLPCDLVIVAAGVAPNVSFLEATPVHVAKGVLVDARMETSVPGIFAAGDVAEAPDLFTGAHLVSAIQPNAADQARVAAINMAGGQARLTGVLAINVLDTLGLISTSFGQWWGDPEGQGVEQVDEVAFRYLSLQFKEDVLIGATSIGMTQHVGALRGMIQGRLRLGPWKDVLLHAPQRFFEAYLAATQSDAIARHQPVAAFA
ncbi:MAG TPA: FAD-dependent oxidoreductase [Zoogloea sp.]|uniref:NAD(P)/FAD-dependent oxidoreductase n=1 Tax=Zoogloea sp. TaxID=49181 RepID=UPI002C4A9F29|nr:FAD-dependent oxidoreductase [Zoogloea sp.]HMV16393.1 FAD-dependent oxidoreductase [Rhodocyclaceae bacterium]HMV61757.1 FAD-dependent oxidoreductase [Rhodocyclaceae bacterium]HMW51151.1 FAD-dependent oxidoreductase [Rhodocyclaceae bacterium]HMY48380.1 FAD-dependent oxidoreductase [Rhodocyclaceae bacterium]HMZ76317.1 FAD-dependent oxidoreductase [Rhodocyclaceae bacterium]